MTNNPKLRFCDVIFIARSNENLTRRRASDLCGIQHSAMNNHETNRNFPTLTSFIRYCNFYNLDRLEMLDLIEKQINEEK